MAAGRLGIDPEYQHAGLDDESRRASPPFELLEHGRNAEGLRDGQSLQHEGLDGLDRLTGLPTTASSGVTLPKVSVSGAMLTMLALLATLFAVWQ